MAQNPVSYSHWLLQHQPRDRPALYQLLVKLAEDASFFDYYGTSSRLSGMSTVGYAMNLQCRVFPRIIYLGTILEPGFMCDALGDVVFTFDEINQLDLNPYQRISMLAKHIIDRSPAHVPLWGMRIIR